MVRTNRSTGRPRSSVTTGPNVGPHPGDAGPELEERRGDEHPLRGAALVERVGDGAALLLGDRDGDGGGRGGQGSRLRQTGLGNAAQHGLLANDHEPPRLRVPARAGPASRIGDGFDGVCVHRLVSELPYLAYPQQRPNLVGGRAGFVVHADKPSAARGWPVRAVARYAS